MSLRDHSDEVGRRSNPCGGEGVYPTPPDCFVAEFTLSEANVLLAMTKEPFRTASKGDTEGEVTDCLIFA